MVRIFVYNRNKKITGTIFTGTRSTRILNNILIIRNMVSYSNIEKGTKLTINNISNTHLLTITKFRYDPINSIYYLTLAPDSLINDINDVSLVSRSITIFNMDYADSESYELTFNTEEFEVEEKVIDLFDITEMSDVITKEIEFYDSEENNRAFGAVYNFNNMKSPDIDNKLSTNYLPMIPVNCQVFMDDELYMSGELLLTENRIDGNKLIYIGTITGKLYNLRNALEDLNLRDLDVRDLSHPYNLSNLLNSWGGYNPNNPARSVGFSTQYLVKDLERNAYVGSEFEFGKGYVYPYIWYGSKVEQEIWGDTEESANFISNPLLQNFRPSIYLKEYFDRIFEHIGYKYRFENPELMNKFRHMIIPNNDEKFITTMTGRYAEFRFTPQLFDSTTILTSSRNQGSHVFNKVESRWAMPFQMSAVYTLPNHFVSGSTYYGSYGVDQNRKWGTTIHTNRTFTTNARIQGTFDIIYNGLVNNTGKPQFCVLQITRRKYVKYLGDFDKSVSWSVPNDGDHNVDSYVTEFDIVAEQVFPLNYNNPIESISYDLIAPDFEYGEGDEIQVRLFFNKNEATSRSWIPQIRNNGGTLKFNYNNETVSYEPKDGDIINIVPPDFSVLDLIKGFAQKFNLLITLKNDTYVFTDYDIYYNKFNINVIKEFAEDISDMFDYKNVSIKYNTELPESYLFTDSKDETAINKEYESVQGEVYGSFKFNDSAGIGEEFKLETPFAATVVSEYPAFRQYCINNSSSRITSESKRIASGVKIAYYNGVFKASRYYVKQLETGIYSFPIATVVKMLNNNKLLLDWYPNASNYYYDPNARINNIPVTIDDVAVIPIPIDDINFAPPLVFNLNPVYEYYNVEGVYRFWRGRMKNMLNVNAKTVEVTLYNKRIKNIAMNTPIFINHPKLGSGYFQILRKLFNYQNSEYMLTLQQIFP